jgi:MoxR-like ATPase
MELSQDIRELNETINRESAFVESIMAEIGKRLVGQKYMVERLLIGLLCNGHVLLEGVPGLAKTLTVRTLADVFSTSFQRIQFTPDLLPADLIGTLIYNQNTGDFTTKKGPIFANIILADEINRAPAKVQSALLEAMQERQVTIGSTTYKLDDPFLVLATQNPIEQEGTYPLPEAQVDRFMLKVIIGYPSRREETEIMRRMSRDIEIPVNVIIKPADISRARGLVEQVYMDEKVENYIIDIVMATRDPKEFKLDALEDMIEYGASPRASIFLARAARAHAFLRRRGFATPEDVRAVCPDVLRHRIIVSYEAEAEEISSDEVIKRILDKIEVP